MTPGPDELQGLTRDWITIWRSEASAGATDRERTESWSVALALWAEFLARALAGVPTGLGRPDGSAGPAAAAAPAGTAAAADASDARDHVVAGLAARVDELERRFAAPPRG